MDALYYLFNSRSTREYSQDELVNNQFFCKNSSDHLTECKIYYNFALLCKENPFSNKIIKVYCSSFDLEGVKLFY